MGLPEKCVDNHLHITGRKSDITGYDFNRMKRLLFSRFPDLLGLIDDRRIQVGGDNLQRRRQRAINRP
jgi:hypothetical protein